jgi:DNA-binding CsgD family transcriptional regulator
MVSNALLEAIATPAYVTDRDNRVLAVNQAFAALVGDPQRDGLAGDSLFIINLILGPYRDCFPRRAVEVPGCAATFASEIDAGRLSPRTVGLWQHSLVSDERVARLVTKAVAGDYEPRWDGAVVFRDRDGYQKELKETVVPLTGAVEAAFLNVWFETSHDTRAAAASHLTRRECEIASLYAIGHSSREVALIAGISLNTARDHRDSIYAKLGVRSRAELTRAMLPA